jgi:DNA-binding NarL/FixJ family response regulator
VTGSESTGRIRVLVLAPYPTQRAGLRALVEEDPALQVAGEADSLDALAARIEELAPQVILLDPGTDLDSLMEGLASFSGSRILPPLVLITPEIDDVTDAVEGGVQGFLLPDATADEIGAALRSVVAGLTVVDSRAVPELLAPRGSGVAPPPAEGPREALSPREREVLQLISQGLPNKTIALELGISEHTVKFHVGSILAKLEASSRAEALARAARLGLIVL